MMEMAEVRMTMAEYLELINGLSSNVPMAAPIAEETKPKRKTTAYQRRYKAAFKKVAPRYKLKSGKWMKNGFKKAVREAHRMARK